MESDGQGLWFWKQAYLIRIREVKGKLESGSIKPRALPSIGVRGDGCDDSIYELIRERLSFATYGNFDICCVKIYVVILCNRRTESNKSLPIVKKDHTSFQLSFIVTFQFEAMVNDNHLDQVTDTLVSVRLCQSNIQSVTAYVLGRVREYSQCASARLEVDPGRKVQLGVQGHWEEDPGVRLCAELR